MTQQQLAAQRSANTVQRPALYISKHGNLGDSPGALQGLGQKWQSLPLLASLSSPCTRWQTPPSPR